jgi:hypothetical protein
MVRNVLIYLGLKGSKVSTQFLIGFFLVGGSHEGMRGGSMEKKKISDIYHYDQGNERRPMG